MQRQGVICDSGDEFEVALQAVQQGSRRGGGEVGGRGGCGGGCRGDVVVEDGGDERVVLGEGAVDGLAHGGRRGNARRSGIRTRRSVGRGCGWAALATAAAGGCGGGGCDG